MMYDLGVLQSIFLLIFYWLDVNKCWIKCIFMIHTFYDTYIVCTLAKSLAL